MAETKAPNTSAEQLITEHLDIWTTAIEQNSSSGRGSSKKFSLHGIKKLRELILELAVRGKLVPQDPNDEPASVLLERIAAEKAQLVKDKKIKKPKALPEISEDEKPFELPEGWRFLRLGEIGYWAIGSGFPQAIQGETGKEVLVCKVSDMNLEGNDKYIYTTKNSVDFETAKVKKLKIHQKGTVIFPKIGGAIATNKRRIIFTPTVIDNNCLGITPYSIFESEYLYLYLKSVDFTYFQAGTSVPALSQTVLELIALGLPPLSEQKRISNKVNELMSLCDALEAQTENSITAHQTLVEVLLEALLKAPEQGATPEQTAEQFQQNWQRLSEHFDTLFTTTASIDTLKQTILQLAVMGKLVPQNPNDEPAAKLLERIAAEKAQLIKDKKIKKQKPLPEITDEEKPFELPRGWSYTRLDDLCANVSSGSTPPKSELSESGDIPFLKVYNIQNQEIEFKERTLFVTKDAHMSKLNRSILFPGDVIMNLVGPPLGKVAIMPSTYPEWNCNQNIVCFRPLELELNKYIYTYLKSHLFLNYITLVGSAGQDFISGTKCRAIALPIPH
ncbi:restriction endonuclease subunit S [Catenovulum sediminis]|uniref:restriction endonuclease subunit S n=1 Tax=Catenovulum sediminis TaxID=1740262 RepID=UPI001FE57F4C|nr:restriction endonuclease subunit S [Catenovulum sediminis]